jgi:hypothetical protein
MAAVNIKRKKEMGLWVDLQLRVVATVETSSNGSLAVV